jgi:hypothetical protein
METNKGRRQRTPADVALVSEGLQLRNRSSSHQEQGIALPDLSKLRQGACGTGRVSRIRIVASALGPA